MTTAIKDPAPNYSAGVIKISESTEQQQHRKTRKPPPRVDINTQFLWFIQRNMLNSLPSLTKDVNRLQFLGTLCLKDTTTNWNMYHMYCCTVESLDRSHDCVIARYRNKPNIKIVNQFATGAVTALSLLESVRKHFSDHKWIAKGKVLITDETYNERNIRETIDDIRNQQLAKFANYSLFLCNVK